MVAANLRFFVVLLFLLFFVQTAEAALTTGMMAYYTSTNPTIPKYRLWTGSAWGAEQNALALAGNVEWVVVRAAPNRPEYIMGAIFDTGSAGVLTVQIYNATNNSWHSPRNMTVNAGTTADAYRFFDIVYENVSGNAMVVYRNDTTTLAYNTWNGASWSYAANIGARINVPSGNCSRDVYWVELAANPLANKSNEIIAVYGNSSGKSCGAIWNGSAWVRSRIIDLTQTSMTTKKIAAAYEQTTGEGLVAWSNATTAGTMYYIPVKNGAWNTTHSMVVDVGLNSPDTVLLAPANGSSAIMLSYQEAAASDAGSIQWSGTAWGTNSEDAATTATGNGYISAGYHGNTGVGSRIYNDGTNVLFPRNQSCTGAGCGSGTWSTVANMYSYTCGESASLDFIDIQSDQFSQDLMMTTTSQTTHYKCSALYNTSGLGTFFNTTTSIGGGSSLATGKDFSFAFDRCGIGNLTVTTNGTAIATNQNTTFVISATATCNGHPLSSCGTVQVGLRYNFSGAAPNVWVNRTWGDKSFYNVSGTNPYNCGTLLGGQTCIANWTVNATGNAGTSWAFDANATPAKGYVYAASSATFVVNITAGAAISLGFSLTVPSANFSNATGTYPGAATSDLNFSFNRSMQSANGDQQYVNPCVVGAVSACQTVTTPIYVFTNTGNVNIAWDINISTALPPYVKMFANKTNGNNATAVQMLSAAGWTVNSSVPPGGTQNLWIWVNFTQALNVPELNQTNITSRGY